MSLSEPRLPFSAKDIVSIRQDLVDSHPASERTSRSIDEPCVESAMQTALQGAYYFISLVFCFSISKNCIASPTEISESLGL